MNMNMEMDPNGNHKEVEFREPKLFKYLFILSHIIGIAAIVLTGVWSAKFFNGFGFENPFQEFNFHPVFMVAMTYLCGNAMLMYRALRFRPRMTVKWLHTVFHALSLLVAAFALFAVIDFHNRANFANFYSLHSWMGIFCCVFYAGKFVVSFTIYMLPCVPTSARKLIMPMHIFGGILVFVLLIASCLTGFTEKIMFRNTKDWSMRQPIGLYVNFIGVLLMSYGALVGLMVYVTEFKN